MRKPVDLPELEADVTALQHTRRKAIAWSKRACALSRALVATQTAILTEQRKIMRHPALTSDTARARGDLAASHRLVRCLDLLYCSIAFGDADADDT